MIATSLALLFAGLGPAPQGPAPVELAWETRAPPNCDAASFERKLGELLPEPSGVSEEPLPVTVRLSVDAQGSWLAEVWLGEVRGAEPRRFESTKCESVVEAAALVVAMELDPSALDRLDEAPADPLEEVEVDGAAQSTKAPVSGDATEPHADTPTPLDLALGLRGGVASQGLPATTAAFDGRLWLRAQHWRLGAGARYRMPTRVEIDGAGGGEFSYLAGRVDACGVLRPRRVSLPVCAGFEAGQLFARGLAVTAPASSRRPWVAARVMPGVEVAATSWLALVLSLELGVVLSRERYFQTGIGPIYEVGPVELGAAMELQFRLFGGRR